MKNFAEMPTAEAEGQIPADEKIGEGELSPVSPEEMAAAVDALGTEQEPLSKTENFAESPAEIPTEIQPEGTPEIADKGIVDHQERDRAAIEELREVMRQANQEQREKLAAGGGGNDIESPNNGGGGGDGEGGSSQEKNRSKFLYEAHTKYGPCEVCKGTGKGKSYIFGLITLSCPACGGGGRVPVSVSESTTHIREKSKDGAQGPEPEGSAEPGIKPQAGPEIGGEQKE